MNLSENEIKNIVGQNNFIKGKNYNEDFIEYKESTKIGNTEYFEFEVESQTDYITYEVTISKHNDEYASSYCDCIAFERMGSCKHEAAVLIHFDELTKGPIAPLERNLKISKEILKEFYKETDKNEISLKRQVNLEVELEFYNRYNSYVAPRFKIGEEKLYSLNNKLNNFLNVYENGKQTISFGKNFTYNPKVHYFNKVDEEILDYLVELKNNNPYYNMNYLSIPLEKLNRLLEKLENKNFIISGLGEITHITKSCPFKMPLIKEENTYKLKFPVNESIKFIDKEFKYAAKNEILYILPEKVSYILSQMDKNRIDAITFEEEDLEIFTGGLLGIIKKEVEIDSSLSDKIVVGTKPKVEIYLDLKGEIILADLKFVYDNNKINYFEKTPNIIRDTETENSTVKDLLTYGFQISNSQIYIDDLELIGDFLTDGITKLATSYEVFTSNKIKDTNILKETNIRSSFNIGTDNILKYEFDLGSIKNDEIVNILESLKSKKKYYRLKSGDIIDLNASNDLKEFDNLVSDMELSTKDIKEGKGTIPKYRAIYLDSIKKEKYHIIKTNNLFDQLIKDFSSYKDEEITLTKKDTNILRDYQITGVKWLYNIYKCGFGGILADEMGLGKSIQLIYFIKQILKEKKNAKILIIAPTSLIYNWKNEFDKFGSELKYKVFAENKEKRKYELEHLKDTNILITTYGLIRQDQELYENMEFELIAIDEAQNIKNVNTKIALTGTPLENSVLELWSIFDFIMPGYLANITNFSRKYNIKDVTEDNIKELNNLNAQITPFILRRKKKDVVTELPDKIENNIYIDLNPEQKKIYVAELEKTKQELDDIIASEGVQKGSFKILTLLGRLRQLCIDPSIIYENYQGGSSKIEELIKLTENIIENGHKILLFTSYKRALDIVNREFTNVGISTYVIDGSVKSKKRMELVDKFNTDDTNVFLITLKSGGTGLNLTSADVVIHLDLWWNPQVENQATDRAHRIGQKNTVEVIKLICKGTIEERILELQNKKKILSDSLIEGEGRDENILSRLTEQDIKNLLSLDNSEEE